MKIKAERKPGEFKSLKIGYKVINIGPGICCENRMFIVLWSVSKHKTTQNSWYTACPKQTLFKDFEERLDNFFQKLHCSKLAFYIVLIAKKLQACHVNICKTACSSQGCVKKHEKFWLFHSFYFFLAGSSKLI